MHIKKVDIRPGVSVLAVLRHLNYRPWFALSEFVDNAVQSFSQNRDGTPSEGGWLYCAYCGKPLREVRYAN